MLDLACLGILVVRPGHDQSRCFAVQPHPQVVLDGVNRRAVHVFQHRWADLGGDLQYRRDRVMGVAERCHQSMCGRLRRHQPQGDLGDDAQGALATDEQLGQREPCDVLEPRPTKPHGPAIGEHHLQT